MQLRCPKCSRTKKLTGRAAEGIPARVETVVVICPKCDDGDFHSEEWFDASGNYIDQLAQEPAHDH